MANLDGLLHNKQAAHLLSDQKKLEQLRNAPETQQLFTMLRKNTGGDRHTCPDAGSGRSQIDGENETASQRVKKGGEPMAEWEEKLEGILSNPQAMEQIMALAKSLEGGNTQQGTPSPTPAAPTSPPPAGPDLSGLLSGVGKLDPKLLSMAAKFMGQMGRQDDRRTALLQALRPFVKPERYAKLDKAIQIAKLSVLIRSGLELFRSKEDSHV